MTALELIATTFSAACLLVPSWPGSTRTLPVSASAWTRPVDDAVCGDDVAIVAALPDPTAVPDRLGEALWVRNRSASAVALDGWRVARGRASARLDGVVLSPGERLRLGTDALPSLRLPNRGGEVRLVDPCGVARSFGWPEAIPGRVVLDPDERGPPAPWAGDALD